MHISTPLSVSNLALWKVSASVSHVVEIARQTMGVEFGIDVPLPLEADEFS
jgi:hypothetical protein